MSFSLKALGAIAAVAVCSAAQAAVIFIDYGQTATTTTSPTWNVSVGSIVNLVDVTGAATGIEAATAGFGGSSAVGGISTGFTGDALAAFGGTFSTAQQDYLYVSGSTATGTVTFNNLSANNTYTFTVFGSRSGGGVRTTDYLIAGATSASGWLETEQNSGNVVVFSNIAPNAGNSIVLSTKVRSGNTSGFGYLNAVKIESTPIPEPVSLALIGLSGLALLRRRSAHA